MGGKVVSAYTAEVLDRRLPERHYRSELHGIRGVAILGVVLFHLFGAGRISGGIDIFLAISGYLFSAMLLREAVSSGGRISLSKYFGRLARRVVVPAAVVVVAITAAGLAILPVTKHAQLWAEARASLLYFENFELINSQLAYGAAGPETSPFQHFWSLSVQGQFYLIWPLITIFAVWLAKRTRRPAAQVMCLLVGVVLAVSFVYAFYLGSFNQDESYLSSFTRIWELAFGGLLGLLGGLLSVPRRWRLPTGWLGVVLIITCGFVLDGAALFPGLWALWPLLGLGLVLASAAKPREENARYSAAEFLSKRAFLWIGDISYGLYLWHWPLLIFYLEIRGREAVGLSGAALILFASVMLAMLLNRFVERPLQSWSRPANAALTEGRARKALASVIIVLLVGGIGSTAVLRVKDTQIAPVFEDWDWETYPGALAVDGQPVPDAVFLPAPEDLSGQRPDHYHWECRQPGSDNPKTALVRVCEDPDAPANPTATVILLGGSHEGHWHHAFRALAAEYGWELKLVTRSGCYLHVSDGDDVSTCMLWQENVIDWLATQDVDLVVATGTRMTNNNEPEYVAIGAEDRWKDVVDSGSELLLIRGTPRIDGNAADCLARGSAPEECGPLNIGMTDPSPLDDLQLPTEISTIDLTKYMCPVAFETDVTAERCSAVVGNVAVWRDQGHLSNTYVETLTPVIEREMRRELLWLFR